MHALSSTFIVENNKQCILIRIAKGMTGTLQHIDHSARETSRANNLDVQKVNTLWYFSPTLNFIYKLRRFKYSPLIGPMSQPRCC
jgi:hypothetical protein